MRKLTILVVIMLVMVLAAVSCASARAPAPQPTSGSAGNDYSKDAEYAPPAAPGIPAPAPAPPPATTSPSSGMQYPVSESGYPDMQSPSSGDRMVVRTGSMQMVVDDISSTLDNITGIAAGYGGYVVSSQRWKEGERNIGSISIRVLAEHYDKVMAELRSQAKSVTSESTSTQDVTEEYVDLDSRVKNLLVTEAQLQKIMETATQTDEVLSIQRELTNVRYEIEQAKGRMQYLERTSATSLITIRLDEAVLALKFNASKITVDTGESEIGRASCRERV